jgi:hypothetical protein
MFDTIGKIIRESLQDNATGRYSSSRVIALLVAFAATVFMWKLVILGGMTIEYFMAYLAYGTGTAGLNKFLDNKDGARTEQAKAVIAAPPKDDDEPLPKPPKT